MSQTRRRSSSTTFRAYSSGRVERVYDLDDSVARIQSVRDSSTQEESLLAQFEEAAKEPENPWDKFIKGPMPDPKDAKRQPLERNEFGAIVFATKAVHNAKNRFKLLLHPQEKKKTNLLVDCRRRRSSAVIPGCSQQKGLAYWVFGTLTKCFQHWRETTRLHLWSQNTVDAYHFDSPSEVEQNSATNESDKEKKMFTVALMKQELGTYSTERKDGSGSNTKRPSALDVMFEDSVAFVDELTSARRDSIKVGGMFNVGEDPREDPRDPLIARMSPKVLLSLHINFVRISKRELQAQEQKEAEERELAIAHSIENGGTGPPVGAKRQRANPTFKEKKLLFLDFVDASGCMPKPPSKLKSAMHAVRSVVRMRKKFGTFGKGNIFTGSTAKQLQAKKESNAQLEASTTMSTKSPQRRTRRGSFQVGMSGEQNKAFNRRRNTVGSAEAAAKASAKLTHTAVVIPRTSVAGADARNFVANLNQMPRINVSVSDSGGIVAGASFWRGSISLSLPNCQRGGRRLQLPTFRVVLVDDSKPFRIKLRTLLQRMFQNIVIELCADPTEGIHKVLGAPADAPINMVIVDQVFVGTKTTGKQMCDILARGSGRRGAASKAMSPCILVSDYIELDAARNVDEVFAEDTKNIRERGRAGPALLAKKANSSSVSTNPHNNIVERCNKREITQDLIFRWFMQYVNKSGGDAKDHRNAVRPSVPKPVPKTSKQVEKSKTRVSPPQAMRRRRRRSSGA